MKLYTTQDNPTGQKVSAVLSHLGLRAETVVLAFGVEGTHSVGYKAINPSGLVPSLVDGDRVIWESNAIMIYLASEKVPENSLFAPEQRTEILQWLFWEAAQYNAALRQIVVEVIMRPKLGFGETRAAVVEAAQMNVRRFGKVLNAHLEGRDFMVGDDWTLADYAIGFGEGFIDHLPVDMSDFPNITAFYARMRENAHWAGNL